MTAIIMRLSVLALVIGVTSGCAQLQLAQDTGADVADGVLAGGIYSVCVAPTVGSLVRRYGSDPDGRAAWELYCAEEWKRGAGEFTLPRVTQ